MRNRIIRTLAVGVGAGALVLGMAAPALAAPAPVEVTKLPANVKIATDGSVNLNVVDAAVCAEGTTGFTAWIPGKQDAVTPSVGCSGTTLVGTVVPNAASKKKNAVVKFVAMSGENKIVQTMVVHVLKTKTPPGQAKKAAS